MASTALAILAAGVIIVLGVLLMKKTHKTKISGVIPLLILGLIVGPLSKYFSPTNTPLFDAVKYHDAIAAIVTFALIVVLFDSGYGLQLSRLKKELLPALSLTILGVIITTTLAGTFSYFFLGLSWQLSLLLAALVASTDLTIIAPLLQQMRLPDYSRDVLELESALNSVLAAILAIVAVAMIEIKGFGAEQITRTFLYNIFVGAALGLLLGYFIVLAIKHMKIEEKPHIISIGAVLLVYAITEIVGASGIVAALIVGIVFRNTGQDLPRLIKSYSGDLEILLIVFVYVLLGTLLDFSALLPIATFALASVFVALVILSRIGAVKIFKLKFKKLDTRLLYFSGPRGIMCATLALFYASYFPDGKTILAMIFLTILVTSVLSSFIPIYKKIKIKPKE